jgi:hypothetical protein
MLFEEIKRSDKEVNASKRKSAVEFAYRILRRLRNGTFFPFSASGSNFNPRNIQYIHVVEIFAFLELE